MSKPVTVDATQAPAPDFAAFEATENAKATGQPLPEPVAAPVADPDADDPEEPVAEATADPVAPDKGYTPPSPTSKRTLRAQELVNERIREATREANERAAALETKLAELESKAAPVAPAVTEPPAPTRPEPNEDDIGTKYDTYAAFARDLAKWVVEQDRAERATTTQTEVREILAQERARARFRDAIDTSQERARKAYPDFDALLESPAGAISLGRTPDEAIDRVAFIANHPQSEHIQYAILKDPALAQRLQHSDDTTFGVTIGSLLTSASASAGPAAKLVTTAPAPPTTLSARSAAPADPSAAALARGDFSAWETEENRKALAAG